MDWTKPFYLDLQDKGKADPYHKELTEVDAKHLELLKYAVKYPGVFTADDLLSIIEALES